VGKNCPFLPSSQAVAPVTEFSLRLRGIIFGLAAVVIAAGFGVFESSANAQGRPRGPLQQRMMQQQQQMQQQAEQQQSRQSDRPPQRDPNAPKPPEVDALDPWLKRVHELMPESAATFNELDPKQLGEAADAVEKWVLLWGRIAAGQAPSDQVEIVGRLVDVQRSIDRQFDDLLAMRADFAPLSADERHAALLGYLHALSATSELNGRLRYALLDIIDDVGGRIVDRLDLREHLIDILAGKHSSVGAQIMAVELFDSPPEPSTPTPTTTPTPTAAMPSPASMRGMRRMAMMQKMQEQQAAQMQQQRQPQTAAVDQPPNLSVAQKTKLIQLIANSGSIRLIDDLADLVAEPNTPPQVVLAAAEGIRRLGLPQDIRPEQKDDKSLPTPAITAKDLLDQLRKIDARQLSAGERSRLNELSQWLADRAAKGLETESYRIGNFEVKPGDWLLMRNPSPYNLFTDLSPGMFTHVGVVAMETGSDGKRRMVIVDLPEKGTNMPATTVDAFLDRTLNYVFLRHPDPVVAQKMGETAGSLIGNPTEFDLNFRTDRLNELAGKPLKDEKIHTYCAGFLILCGQTTGLARDVFFPITETIAPGHTQENIAKLGLSLGDGFVSPTGALFSKQLKIVGRSEPIYDPMREIEEAIFDHFAQDLETKSLQPSSDGFPQIRLKVAEASQTNPLLAKALAASAGVSEQMDLVSAAKAAAVVESLDSIAFGSSAEFQAARSAIIDGGEAMRDGEKKLKPEERDTIMKYRSRHADLASRWDREQLSRRALRMELVNYYRDQGCRQLDERFFSADGKR
jgi:hypothetical protein